MIRFAVGGLLAVLALAVPARPSGKSVFPFPARIDKMENGLTIVSVPLANPDIIAYYTIVRSGSRNEIEPGKSGFAHFFEHMMFKGTKQVPKAAYDEFLTRLGAGTNGFTSDDYTCYYVVFAGRENLETVIKTEADRFINLAYTEDTIKTEAPVIEGEYNTSAANPGRRLIELLRDTAYSSHPYKHTTLGFLKDIQDMPNQFEYSQLYKKRFYAPDNTILLVAGDFDPTRLMALARKYYGGWEPSNYALVTPAEPAQAEPRRAHYPWPVRTLSRLAVGFHGPAYSDESGDKAALNLMAEISFSPFSPLYQRLVNKEQKCLSLGASFADTRDPSLLVFNAVVKSAADLPYVEKEILKELERIKSEPVSPDILADVKSNLRYGMAAALGTTDGVAGTLAFYINLAGDPGTLNKLFDLYERTTPRNIQDAARKYFRAANSTTVTLASGDVQ
jgi:zinc protease